MRNSIRAAGALALLIISATVLADDRIYTGFFSNVAVGGYDTVAYFTDGRPVEGKKDFTTRWQGADFRFATREHQKQFEADPERYAPQFGGYCAWAVSQGYTAKGSPEFWKIVDGRLYLNYNADVQQTWETDIDHFIQAADQNWPRVLE